MNNPRMSKKEANLVKGAIRRVFSRSELRQFVISQAKLVDYTDSKRPRVSKWSMCAVCSTPTPQYLAEVDHIIPIVPVDKTLEDLSWDDIINSVWCEKEHLQVCCKSCHKIKTKAELKERIAARKKRKDNNGSQ